MAAVMINAANMAYRKAVQKTRDDAKTNPDAPRWLKHFAHKLPEREETELQALTETREHRVEYTLAVSEHQYDRFAAKVYMHVTNTAWFEAFIMLNIVLVGFATGLDLENEGSNQWVVDFVDVVGYVTLSVFTLECVFKFITYARRPFDYFTDRDDGTFNTFDFLIVVASYAFLGNSNGGAIGGLRMLRLVRILTFIKGIPQLRVIITGLAQGISSVNYIIMLLFLVVYLFAILGTLLFGVNDPVHFGDVPVSMLTLFQVSTMASWTGIAYVSMFGCSNYVQSPYGDHTSRVDTIAGSFEGFLCPDKEEAQPLLASFFFGFYILITAWVIMSLFIGVMSMGMFEAFIEMKQEQNEVKVRLTQEKNTALEKEGGEAPLLKREIDAIFDESNEVDESTSKVAEIAATVRDHDYFSLLITLFILLIGVFIGIDTDFTLKCKRIEGRLEDDTSKVSTCDDGNQPSLVVGYVAQAVFTAEFVIKVLAEGSSPLNFFTDRENGPWNSLDFLIVCIGFIELTPLAFIFEAFPVVILRLLRLLRVFRLARSLPKLRSIVEALISGFSSVGWICVLMLLYEYISACLCMIVFKENDPFHFGTLGRSMFTMLRIQTFDSWDQILYIAIFGCEGYPAGYDFLNSTQNARCENSIAFGWLAPAILFPLAIIGGFIMPTVLIGIVAIKFDEATRYFADLAKIKADTTSVTEEAQVYLPNFLTKRRIDAIRRTFDAMDASANLSLELPEMSPFLNYSFEKLFGVELTLDQAEALFYIADASKSTRVGFGAFTKFVTVMKQVEEKCKNNPKKAAEIFGEDFKQSAFSEHYYSSWNAAMRRVDKVAREQAWEKIFIAINSVEGGVGLNDKVKHMYEKFDCNGTRELDVDELGRGLLSIGANLNDRQMRAFMRDLDANGDGKSDVGEFQDMCRQVLEEKERTKLKAITREIKSHRAKLEAAEREASGVRRRSSRRKSLALTELEQEWDLILGVMGKLEGDDWEDPNGGKGGDGLYGGGGKETNGHAVPRNPRVELGRGSAEMREAEAWKRGGGEAAGGHRENKADLLEDREARERRERDGFYVRTKPRADPLEEREARERRELDGAYIRRGPRKSRSPRSPKRSPKHAPKRPTGDGCFGSSPVERPAEGHPSGRRAMSPIRRSGMYAQAGSEVTSSSSPFFGDDGKDDQT